MLSWHLMSSIDFFITWRCSTVKDFKAFTSSFKLLIYSSFVSFTMKSIGCSLEMGETGVVCVCVEDNLADTGVRGWPGRGAVSSLAQVIVLLAERILKCSSITSFVRSSCSVFYKFSVPIISCGVINMY